MQLGSRRCKDGAKGNRCREWVYRYIIIYISCDKIRSDKWDLKFVCFLCRFVSCVGERRVVSGWVRLRYGKVLYRIVYCIGFYKIISPFILVASIS